MRLGIRVILQSEARQELVKLEQAVCRNSARPEMAVERGPHSTTPLPTPRRLHQIATGMLLITATRGPCKRDSSLHCRYSPCLNTRIRHSLRAARRRTFGRVSYTTAVESSSEVEHGLPNKRPATPRGYSETTADQLGGFELKTRMELAIVPTRPMTYPRPTSRPKLGAGTKVPPAPKILSPSLINLPHLQSVIVVLLHILRIDNMGARRTPQLWRGGTSLISTTSHEPREGSSPP